MDAVVGKRRNVFLTGRAGTGKTYLLEKIKARYPGNVVLTATTGVAATHIHGVTLHSFAMMSPHSVSHPKAHLKRIGRNRGAIARFRNTDLLVIDEVSMMSPAQFRLLDRQCQILRGQAGVPFGGIQLLLCGDFLQLPPVPERGKKLSPAEAVYCFETKTWTDAGIQCIQLTHCFRQSEDPRFASILDGIRVGKCSPADERTIQDRSGDFDTEPINLVCKNATADGINSRRLGELRGPTREYRARDAYYKLRRGLGEYKDLLEALGAAVALNKPLPSALRTCLFPETLALKRGARVMLLRNMEVDGVRLCNGSMGTVDMLGPDEVLVRFDSCDRVLSIREDRWSRCWADEVSRNWRHRLAVRTQIPLRLAWAISIHKSQGMTLERARVDLRQVFEKHQVYVALSRIQSLEGLSVQGFRRRTIRVDPRVAAFYREFSSRRCVECAEGMPLGAPAGAERCPSCRRCLECGGPTVEKICGPCVAQYADFLDA